MKLPILSRRLSVRDALVHKATREAETGRRLAIYDRQTGLYAYWYLVRRFEEEARRAERYARPLTALLIEVSNRDGFTTQDGVTQWLDQELRSTDLACHLGDGRYLLLLTETSPEDGAALAGRLAGRFAPSVAIGLGSYPEDGDRLDDLKKAAERRTHGNWALAG